MVSDVSFRIYIIHAKPLKAQREHNINRLKEIFNKLCDVERFSLITKYDPEDLSKMNLAHFTDFSQIEGTDAAPLYNSHIRQINLNQLSNSMKHSDVISKIADYENDDDDDDDNENVNKNSSSVSNNSVLHLVLEDDSLAMTPEERDPEQTKNVVRQFIQLAKQSYFEKRWGFFFPCISAIVTDGDGVSDNDNKDDQSKKESLSSRVISIAKSFETSPQFIPPVCNAYCITPTFAKALHNWTKTVKFTWNIQLSYALHMVHRNFEDVGDIIATRRLFFMDGSKTGHFVSTLSGQNVLTLSPEYMNLLKESVNPDTTERKIQEKVDKFRDTPGVIYNHPDVLRVQADALIKLKRLPAAHEILHVGCDELFKHELVLVNNASDIMKKYIRSYAYVQDTGLLPID